METPNLFLEATLGECKAITPVDCENGKHPVWQKEVALEVSDITADLRLLLWHAGGGAKNSDVCVGRVIVPLVSLLKDAYTPPLFGIG